MFVLQIDIGCMCLLSKKYKTFQETIFFFLFLFSLFPSFDSAGIRKSQTNYRSKPIMGSDSTFQEYRLCTFSVSIENRRSLNRNTIHGDFREESLTQDCYNAAHADRSRFRLLLSLSRSLYCHQGTNTLGGGALHRR